MRQFTRLRSIPQGTFSEYVDLDLSKRKPWPPVAPGKSTIISRSDGQAVIDVVRFHDRSNKGLNVGQIVSKIQEVAGPACTRKAAENHWHNTLKQLHRRVITGNIKVQSTTKDRTAAISAENQIKWFDVVAEARAECRRLSGEEPDADGRTYRQLEHYFTANLDEEGLLANIGGNLIVGDKEKGKHERTNDDSRVSISAVRCGIAAGVKGPSLYLMTGTNKRAGFTDRHLVEHGAPPGSTVVMTPSAYMMNSVWDEIAETIAKGLCNMAKHALSTRLSAFGFWSRLLRWRMVWRCSRFANSVKSSQSRLKRLQSSLRRSKNGKSSCLSKSQRGRPYQVLECSMLTVLAMHQVISGCLQLQS